MKCRRASCLKVDNPQKHLHLHFKFRGVLYVNYENFWSITFSQNVMQLQGSIKTNIVPEIYIM